MPTDQAMTWFLCMNKFGGRCGQCFSIKLYMYYMVTLFRYYVAEGVRIYCQQSWKMVVGTEGKQLVEKYITEIVSMHLLCGLLLWKGILPNYYCSNKIRSVGAFRNHTSLLANLFCGAKNHFNLLYFRCVDVCNSLLSGRNDIRKVIPKKWDDIRKVIPKKWNDIRKNIPKKWVHSYFSGKTCQAKGREKLMWWSIWVEYLIMSRIRCRSSLNYILVTVDT